MNDTANETVAQETTLNVEDLIRKVRIIEAKVKELNNEHEAKMKPYTDLALGLRGFIKEFLEKSNVRNTKTKYGTAYLLTKVSVRVEDKTEFQRHVIGTEAWDMIIWAANKTGVDAFEKEHSTLPPGLMKSETVELRILSPTKPRTTTTKQPKEVQELGPAEEGEGGFDDPPEEVEEQTEEQN